jgi:hypothetical protein
MINNTFEAVNAKSFLPFDSDFGSGRCRISKKVFISNNLKLGWIVRLRLEAYNFDILCTAWPDYSSHLPNENCICIDDSVYIGEKYSNWISGKCSVRKAN